MTKTSKETPEAAPSRAAALIVVVAMTAIQLVGAASIVVGVWLALPAPFALIVDGALVLAIGVAMELILSRRRAAR